MTEQVLVPRDYQTTRIYFGFALYCRPSNQLYDTRRPSAESEYQYRSISTQLHTHSVAEYQSVAQYLRYIRNLCSMLEALE